MKAFLNVAAASLISCLALTACTVHKTEAPSITGPSDLALSTRLEANPDTIGQDGGSQSSIRVFANGPDGKPLAGVTFRVDMEVRGVVADFGGLSARSIVTASDGIARVIYTAPAADPAGLTELCDGVPGTCVTIVATPSSTAFSSVAQQRVRIRLVPLGVILPPAQTPTAAFTFTPTPVNFNIPATFDASTSCGGTVVGGRCTSASAITSYAWDFGDGATATGRVVNHTFTSGTQTSTSFDVTLTVINDRGVSASTTQKISVGASPAPTGDWTFSPAVPVVGETVFFNATQVQPAPGHRIVSYNWNFGDGTTGTGVLTTHVFTQARVSPDSYSVVLSVVDDAGATLVVAPKALQISSGLTANFTFSVQNAATHTMTFDGSGSTVQGNATIVSYSWAFGDGGSGSGQVVSHPYPAAGTFTVRLTITDSLGRTAQKSQNVTVP
jgi:PKD repeat protein